jgi:hypothetical protein
MKPEILKTDKISPGQSIICIVGAAEVPDMLKLSKTEKEYALKQLKADEEYVFINSYIRCTYLVKVKNEKSHFRTREN